MDVLVKANYKDKEYEWITFYDENGNYDYLILDKLSKEEIEQFYNGKLKIDFEVIEDPPCYLWLAETNVSFYRGGCDYYRGAIVSAYTEKQARELLEELSDDFEGAYLEKIGEAFDKKPKIILTDYKNG